MEFKRSRVYNFAEAIRGMRHPLESYHKADSWISNSDDGFVLGANDKNLAQRLINSGSEHRKFLRQIMVSVEITAPMYWWSEFDTYKIGTVANSTSKMHKLSTTSITTDRFELSDNTKNDNYFYDFLNHLEMLREAYLKTKDKDIWETLLQELPESWLQTRTVTMNYENLYSMIRQRKNHKLIQWSGLEPNHFMGWAKRLPYADELLFYGLED